MRPARSPWACRSCLSSHATAPRPTTGYTFEALFGVADPNIRFRQTFTVEFDIGDFNLAGFSLGCGVQQTVTADRPNGPLPFNQWDIVTMVSGEVLERRRTNGSGLG